MISEEVACRTGFQKPLIQFEHEHDKGYRGSVQLTPLESSGTGNLVARCVEGNPRSNEFEAANGAMYNIIGLLADKFGSKIVDPSSALADLG